MTPLTPEQQAFAEEHHGLILDFMEKHSLDDDYYGLLAQRSENCRRSQSSSIVRFLHLKLLRLMKASGA